MDNDTPADPPPELRAIVRPLPKVVFFYLTWLVSLLCGLWPGEPAAGIGQLWMAVFFFNILVISFDFNEERSLVALFVAIAVVFALLYFNILGSVSGWFTDLAPTMNRTFYFMVFGGFSLVYAAVWINTRFNYWEFRPNEVVHHFGIFKKMKRYSTEDMRWDKTVPDMLERLLLGTGSITLTTPHEKHPVVIDHVMRISRLDDKIADILGVKQVVARQGQT